MSGLNELTVCGGGVLGAQIAWHSAFKGKSVTVYDISQASIDKCRDAHRAYARVYEDEIAASRSSVEAAQERVSYATDLAQAVAGADIVIEAVPEVPEIKLDLYGKLADGLRDGAIIATNTSTLLPSMFAEATGRPDRYCALHFANRIWHANVAEVMPHPGTSRKTLTNVTRFAIEIGMVPIPIRKEHSGYVVNSLLIPLLHAAQSLVTNGISDPQTVDRTFMIMNRGVRQGPFGAFDLIGLGTAHDILRYWGEKNGDQQMLANAAYLKAEFLDKGYLGLQSGQGYYSYPDPSFLDPGFLDIPDVPEAEEIARLTFPQA